jgi:hypothetical protein
MTKQGFNILIEKKYIEILVAYGKSSGTDNKTQAFRYAMEELDILHHDRLKPLLDLARKEKQLVKRTT